MSYIFEEVTGAAGALSFKFNGQFALKNYNVEIVNGNRLKVVSTSNEMFSLLEADVSEVEINGMVYSDPNAAQIALTSLVYSAAEPVVLSKEQYMQLAAAAQSENRGPILPSTPVPTGGWLKGWYKPALSSLDSNPTDPTDYGTLYSNAGGKRVKYGYDTSLYYDGGAWTKIEVKMPTAEPSGLVEEDNTEAVAGGEVYEKAVLKSGLEITNVQNSKNLVNPQYVVNDMIVVTTGADARSPAYAGGVGIYKMPMAPGTVITISGYIYKSNLFWGYYNDADTVLAHSVVESDGIMTLTAPGGTTCFSMLFKHHSGTYAVPNVMIVEGPEAMPYEPWTPPVGYLGAIDGNKIAATTLIEDNIIPDPINDDNAVNLRKMKEYVAEHAGVGGGEAYDQSLNTTDNVEFATVTSGNLIVGSLTVDLLIVNLKTGAGAPPAGLISREAYLDTNDYVIKVKP